MKEENAEREYTPLKKYTKNGNKGRIIGT